MAEDKMSRDWCREYLSDHIFKLRPEDYRREHPIWPGLIGIEVEMMPIDLGSLSGQKAAMTPLHGPGGLQSHLKAMLPSHRLWRPESHQDGTLQRILLEDDDQLTFEPGGQLEYSSKPYPCLDDACKRMVQVQNDLDGAMKDHGVRLLQMGSHPWQAPDDIGLQMAKPRYKAMNDYFDRIGPAGRQMMRGTCTVQVNLDFGGREQTMAKRFLAANLMAPVLTGIFAHSPLSSGAANGLRTIRAKTWQDLDTGRTGFPQLGQVQRDLTQASCVEAYLDHILAANVVFVESQGFKVPPQPTSFEQWMAEGIEGVFPTRADLETHLSLHFPEVRARGFLELRSIDCQARAWQLVPACLVTGILYDHESLDKLIEIMNSQEESLGELWKKSVFGLQDVALRKLAVKTMELAMSGFRRLPACYQGTGKGKVLAQFAQRFTMQGRCPADEVLEVMEINDFRAEVLFSLHDKWLESIS